MMTKIQITKIQCDFFCITTVEESLKDNWVEVSSLIFPDKVGLKHACPTCIDGLIKTLKMLEIKYEYSIGPLFNHETREYGCLYLT